MFYYIINSIMYVKIKTNTLLCASAQYSSYIMVWLHLIMNTNILQSIQGKYHLFFSFGGQNTFKLYGCMFFSFLVYLEKVSDTKFKHYI